MRVCFGGMRVGVRGGCVCGGCECVFSSKQREKFFTGVKNV